MYRNADFKDAADGAQICRFGRKIYDDIVCVTAPVAKAAYAALHHCAAELALFATCIDAELITVSSFVLALTRPPCSGVLAAASLVSRLVSHL